MDRYHLILHVWVKCLALTILSAIILGCVPSEGEHGRKFISEVVDAKLSLLEGQSRQLEISASGKVPSAGWTAPTLVPFEYSAPPQDGIYDFSFYATPSKESSASVITAIQVTHRLNPLPADLKGVRIHGETNDIVVMLEAPTPAPVPQIIYEIFGAKLSRVQGQADQLQIHVQGTVFSSGWSNATLIAAEYITPPADGIYDFTFYATPPSEVSKPAIAPIEVTRRLTGVPSNLTGVRIHAQTNNVTVLLDFQEPPLASAAIYEIKQVNLLLKTVPPQLSINVKGTVPSGGWTEQTLVPLEPGGSPKDGIYEFTYMATPPSGPALPVVTATELTYVVNSVPDDLLGVRVYSATNSMEAMLPRENPKPDPVLIQEVNDVQLSIVESVTRQLTITAAGMVNSTGWSSPVLAPFIYGVAPQDGIYDFSFYATPPVNSGAMVLTPINAVYVLGAIPETLKGVRIHYANNEIVVMLDKQQPPLMPAIIYAITNVQLATVSDVPDQLDIHVEGVVTSGGWTQPMLVAQQYLSAPPDGIYDFTFYATPPDGPAAGAFGPINVVHRLTQLATGFRGVRIHANTNSVASLLAQDPARSVCDFVSGNMFETAELYEGGLGPPGVDTRYHWNISFTADGTFVHHYSDVGGMGTYYCDDAGFHLLGSLGVPYVPWDVTVDIPNQSINLPFSPGVDRYYFLVSTQ